MQNFKYPFLLALISLVFASCSHKEVFEVAGQIKNSDGTMLYLQKMDLNTAVTIDSLELSSTGDFSFTGTRLEEPTFLLLKLSDDNFITLLADSTEQIQVQANGANLENTYTISNSDGSSQIQLLNKRMAKLNSDLSVLVENYKQLDEKDEASATQLETQYAQLINDHKAFVAEYVMANPRSFASYYALFQRMDDGNMVMNVIDKKDQVYFSTMATSLNLFYPESDRAKKMYEFVLKIKMQQRIVSNQEQLASMAKSVGYIDLKEKDVNGNEVVLSSLEGKVILLSFWASWDKNSRKENENLKKLYSKYKSRGFEIYQVSLDRSKILWQNAIEKDQLPWINVSDLLYTDSRPARLYNVKHLPSNILISKEGTIIGKNLFGSRLTDKLGELF